MQAFLNPLGIKCLTPKELDIKIEPEENAPTFSGNAFLKAQAFYEAAGGKYPVISDDSGLCVEALGGRPGALSARYGGKRTTQEKNSLLLSEVKEIFSPKAYFITHLCFYLEAYQVLTIEESLQGILKPPSEKGESGFGYDPIFYPEGMNKSLGECTMDEKNKISARGKALRKLTWLLKDPDWSENQKLSRV